MSSGGSTLVKRLLNQYKLVVIEKHSCPYCASVKRILSKYNLKNGTTQMLNIEGRPDSSEIQRYLEGVSKIWTVPQVFVAGQFIGGATDIKKLEDAGQLETILKENHII